MFISVADPFIKVFKATIGRSLYNFALIISHIHIYNVGIMTADWFPNKTFQIYEIFSS